MPHRPRPSSQRGLALANKAMAAIRTRLDGRVAELDALADAPVAAGAPFVEGVSLE